VRDGGDRPRRQERADEPQRQHRNQGRAQPPHPDVDAAVEQDRDERDHRDALDREDRHVVVEARPEVRRQRRGGKEQRRGGHWDALGQARREDGDGEPSGKDQDERGEVGDFGHRDATPTRLPGTPAVEATRRGPCFAALLL
jgi:hypothetical protein